MKQDLLRVVVEDCPSSLTLRTFGGAVFIAYVRHGMGQIDEVWPKRDDARHWDFDPGPSSREVHRERLTTAAPHRPPEYIKKRGWEPVLPLIGLAVSGVNEAGPTLDARFHVYAENTERRTLVLKEGQWERVPSTDESRPLRQADLLVAEDAWGAPIFEHTGGGRAPSLSRVLESLLGEEVQADPALLDVESTGLTLLAWRVRDGGELHALLRYEPVEASVPGGRTLLEAHWSAEQKLTAVERLPVGRNERIEARYSEDGMFILRDATLLVRHGDTKKEFAVPSEPKCGAGDPPTTLAGVGRDGTPWLRRGRCVFRRLEADWELAFHSPDADVDELVGVATRGQWLHVVGGAWWSHIDGQDWKPAGEIPDYVASRAQVAVSSDGHLWIALRAEATRKDTFQRPVAETRIWSSASLTSRSRCR